MGEEHDGMSDGAVRAVKCWVKVVPTKAEFCEYITSKHYAGWGWSAGALFKHLREVGWLMPDGSKPTFPRTWRKVVRAYWEAYQPVLQKHEEERKALRKQRREAKKARLKAERKAAAEKRRKEWHEAHKDFYHAYTDGSCCYAYGVEKNGSRYGAGGSAYVVLKDGVLIHEAKVGKKLTTSNRMEMLAIISVLNWLPMHSKVVIHSDSLYSIRVFSGVWNATANLDLVKLYDEKSALMDSVELRWVKGHNGNKWNEYVDGLASGETSRIINEYRKTLTC